MNTLSTDVGYRGAATAAAIAAILISTNWLRQLPSRAPLARIVPRAPLGGATVAVILAAVNTSWEGPATIAATVLTTSAVLIPTELERAVELLAGIALTGFGVASIGVGVAVLRDTRVLTGIALIGGGVAIIGYGVASLGRIGILAATLTWLTSLAKDPSSEVLHDDDPPVSGPDDPLPGTPTPTSKSP